jgi:hypothetical protein
MTERGKCIEYLIHTIETPWVFYDKWRSSIFKRQDLLIIFSLKHVMGSQWSWWYGSCIYNYICNQWYQNKQKYGTRKQQYDYKITDAVEFSKLFLLPNMAHYTKFDSKCDSSALFFTRSSVTLGWSHSVILRSSESI